MSDDGDRETAYSAHRVAQILKKADWAAGAFARFGRADVLRIAEAAADAAAAKADHYAEWACRETGFGNPEHKKIKNRLCSRGIFDYYRDTDFTGYRVDPERKIVEIARPAGVVFALVPSTNPVCTVFFKVLLALLTRNAIVISPHPAAKECCADAARLMAAAAEGAGAPDGVIQVIDEPSIPVIEYAMKSERTDVILATGGTAMVRAAYSSGNPALGVGPGNAPAYVHESADLAAAARRIADSKSFDNSILCTNESAIVADARIAEPLRRELRRQGCHVCSEAERDAVEAKLFPGGRFDVAFVGLPATRIAELCGFRVPGNTRVLVVPLHRIGDDYPLSREKLCPVLGFFPVPGFEAALTACRAMVRRSGGGHSAAIHADDPAAVLRFGAELDVLRVVVNAPCSTGAAGFQTHLAPTMTVGTGFFGRSSVGENVQPHHLIHWTRIAYDKDEPFPSFEGLELARRGPVAATVAPDPAPVEGSRADDLREEIRRIIIEELREIAGRP